MYKNDSQVMDVVLATDEPKAKRGCKSKAVDTVFNSQMEDHIDQVQLFECLYNKKHKDYRNN